MVQWLRIYLPMQGTLVRSLVWEDPTRGGATKLVCHNSSLSLGFKAHTPQLLKPTCPKAHAPQREEPPRRDVQAPQLEISPHLPKLEKAHVQQPRPSAAKNELILELNNARSEYIENRLGMKSQSGEGVISEGV